MILSKAQFPLRPLIILLDSFIIVLAFYASYWARIIVLRIIPFGAETELQSYYGIVLTILVIWLWLLSILGAYNRPMFVSMRREFRIVLKTVIFGGLILFTSIFFLKLDFSFLPRSLMFIFFLFNLCLLCLEKFVLFHWVSRERKKGHRLQSSVVVGNAVEAIKVVQTLQNRPEFGLKAIGIFCDGFPPLEEKMAGVTVLGKIRDIGPFLHKNHVDEVILTTHKEIEGLLRICEEEGVRTRLISHLFSHLKSNVVVERLGDMMTINLFIAHEKEWQILFKRLMDICVATLLLVLLSPLFLLIIVLIKLTSPGPVLYEWKVMGFNKKPFKSWKFRTMVADAEKLKGKLIDKNEMNGPVFKIKDDPRIIPIGKFLRKFSLDELPQLISVVKGDMSLVGPRPPLVTEIERFEQWHGKKLRTKPGLTCLWQVNGRNEIESFDEWVKLDLKYIENWSLWLDMKILLKTIPAVLKGTGQ